MDQLVDQNKDVRLVDFFVGSLSLSEFGFKLEFIENGRPAYHPSDLLRLFIYSYEPYSFIAAIGKSVYAQPEGDVAPAQVGSWSPYNYQF